MRGGHGAHSAPQIARSSVISRATCSGRGTRWVRRSVDHSSSCRFAAPARSGSGRGRGGYHMTAVEMEIDPFGHDGAGDQDLATNYWERPGPLESRWRHRVLPKRRATSGRTMVGSSTTTRLQLSYMSSPRTAARTPLGMACLMAEEVRRARARPARMSSS